jgi:hypothetical protein
LPEAQASANGAVQDPVHAPLLNFGLPRNLAANVLRGPKVENHSCLFRRLGDCFRHDLAQE